MLGVQGAPQQTHTHTHTLHYSHIVVQCEVQSAPLPVRGHYLNIIFVPINLHL
jgi:hypothetical protein